jgi:hypothetical protein
LAKLHRLFSDSQVLTIRTTMIAEGQRLDRREERDTHNQLK